jgi:hypothetical protein
MAVDKAKFGLPNLGSLYAKPRPDDRVLIVGDREGENNNTQ